ncbi:hypothetical protein SAMN02745146_0424 [Hymenobacter daecheongensis DSM 21074]|uniref:Outer membrane protein beta-barrel domain-containing protein n=2 Tax=Hymenobacter daecheongensis TaxID=496053 RepID=A0A1M6A0G9_9BACT|nr:hypothetical protein SAMN02745146_0424 [Hymenobacter daecheongensis DSM 21074]
MLLPSAVAAQVPDTVDWQRARYRAAPRTVLRVGGAFQPKAWLEVGLARHAVQWQALGIASSGPYVATDFRFTRDKVLLGPKVGYSFGAMALGGDISAAYYTDFSRGQLVITPALGIGAAGFINLLYGYNARFGGSRFAEVGRHRLSISANLNFRYQQHTTRTDRH